MFVFIKAVSDTVLNMTASRETALIFIGAKFQEKFVSIYDQSRKAVSATVFVMINTVYHDKLLIFIGTTFREKFVSIYDQSRKAVSAIVFVMTNTVYHDKLLIFISRNCLRSLPDDGRETSSKTQLR